MMWNEVKEKFEKEFLSPALHGRLRVEYTDYDDDVDVKTLLTDEDVGMRDNCLAFYADNRLIYKFDTRDYTEQFSSINGHLRHTIQEILAKNYLSRSDAFEASCEVVDEFIPWLTSRKGIMRAEHAVRIMREFVNSSKPYDLSKSNVFAFVLWYLSKDLCGSVVLDNEDITRRGYEEEWFYPFIELRIDAEKQYSCVEEVH